MLVLRNLVDGRAKVFVEKVAIARFLSLLICDISILPKSL